MLQVDIPQGCIVPGCTRHAHPVPVLGSSSCLQHVGFIARVVESYLAVCNQQNQQAATPVAEACQPQPTNSTILTESILKPMEFPGLPVQSKTNQLTPIKSKPVQSKVVSPEAIQQGCQNRISGTRCYGDYHDCNNQWGNTECSRCHITGKYLRYLKGCGVTPTEYDRCQGPKWKNIARPDHCDGDDHLSYAKRCHACDMEGGTDVFRDMRKEMADKAAHC